MENALFYTFSTIAQTLAASIALLGAFALYRLQTIGVALQELSTFIIQPYLPDDTASRLCGQEMYAELNEYLGSVVPKNGLPLYAYQEAQHQTFARYLKSSKSIRFRLKWALATTLLVIVASVAVLVFTPAITCNPVATKAVFAVGLLALVGCLWLHAAFVVNALK